MNPWRVEIQERQGGQYVVWVWMNDKDLGTKHDLKDEDELKQFLDSLWEGLGSLGVGKA